MTMNDLDVKPGMIQAHTLIDVLEKDRGSLIAKTSSSEIIHHASLYRNLEAREVNVCELEIRSPYLAQTWIKSKYMAKTNKKVTI